MATNENDSFIIFLYAYDELQWTENNAVVGYDSDNGRFFNVPNSKSRKIIEITEQSNVDTPGTWIFHVNGGAYIFCVLCLPIQPTRVQNTCQYYIPRPTKKLMTFN